MSEAQSDDGQGEGPRGRPSRRLRALMILPPILIGVLVLVWQIAGREGPQQDPPREVSRAVRVVEVRATTFVPRAMGYGFVQPDRVWDAVAQVEGRIAARHPLLERGQILEAGSELLRIDPTDYELAVARAEADLASIRAQLAELEVEEKNLRSSLAIERRALDIEERELARQKKLRTKGNVSQARVDESESALLLQRQRAQDLDNQLGLLPSRRDVLQASERQSAATLSEARVDLERTQLRLPFAARIAEVEIETAQFVRSGDRLVVADSVDSAEISVQIPLERMRPLVPQDLDISGLSVAEFGKAVQRMGIRALVRLPQAEFTLPWEARFDRTSDTVDPKTRTLGVIVVVDEPYRSVLPGRRPPLTKNMFVQVELSGRERAETIVIPRIALHDAGSGAPVVYLAGPDDRLVRRPVAPGPAQGDVVVIEDGLAPGERVVVTDLVPAIEGMLLAPVLDEALMRQVASAAAGSGSAQ